jgi:formiminotetrahydrofolate cyclodeaminase
MSSDPAAQSIATQPVGAFLESLAAKVPTPGGGASASITGATAAATAAMVVSYSVGKKKLAEHEEHNQNAMLQLTRARAMFLQLGDEDAQGYGALNALWGLDKDDPKRIAGWDEAVQGAIAPPRAMLALSLELLRLCASLVNTTNKQLRSDLGVAAVLGEAAARSAAWNVRINIPLLPEAEQNEMQVTVGVMLEQASALCASIESGCA